MILVVTTKSVQLTLKGDSPEGLWTIIKAVQLPSKKSRTRRKCHFYRTRNPKGITCKCPKHHIICSGVKCGHYILKFHKRD